MSLINRGPNKPKPQTDAQTVEPEIDELCVETKQMIVERLQCTMQTFEVRELVRDLCVQLDRIDAAYRVLRPKADDKD
jgi:hypothetical protein